MTDREQKIMVAVDGSEAANHALDYAARLAAKIGAEIIILHVISSKKMGYWAFIDKHLKVEMEQASEKIKQKAQETVEKYDVKHQWLLREVDTHPYLAIADTLEEHRNILMMVLGDKGQALSDHAALGLTTDRMLHEVARRQIPVPILVVPYAHGEIMEI